MKPIPQNDNARWQAGEVGSTNNTQSSFSYPDPHSVKGRVLGALLSGQHITHLDCWHRFGSARLAHHVYKLRGIGWPVEMIDTKVKTRDAGRAATIGVYQLLPAEIAAAGEQGQLYAAEAAKIEAERRSA